ncbi:MAG: hypothetical protein AAGF85_15850 [Bacteroidota bacterium]
MKFALPLLLSYATLHYSVAQEPQWVTTSDFELIRANESNTTLVLFPCFPCKAVDTKREFNIVEQARLNNISVLFMNYNRKLFMQEHEKATLADLLLKTIEDHQLPKNLVIGGFSGGGNVTLLLSNYLIKQQEEIKLSKIFIVDAPVDLLALYRSSEYHLKQDLNEDVLGESTFLINWFKRDLGNPDMGIASYEKFSPYTHETGNLSNVNELKKTEIRFYTEPDVTWWKQIYNDTYGQLNAYSIEKMSEALQSDMGNSRVELIITENRGYRSDGTRHPHSWSIVDKEELISWIID